MVGLESYWGTHGTGAGSAGAGYVNDYTGALTVVNTGVVTAGNRFPLSISHVYNSNDTEDGNGWRLNYDQTIKIPLNTVDINTYPYVYTDEDGLGLFIVPVSDADLKTKYPLKLIDKSSSVVKYFDTFGRLAMITDSNQYENGKNSDTKEKNAVTITYENYGNPVSFQAYDDGIAAAQAFRDICYKSGVAVGSDEYTAARDKAVSAINTLKKDIYTTSDYKTAKTKSDAILTAIKKAKTLAEPYSADSTKRHMSVLNKECVDGIAFDKKRNCLRLLITDHLEWNDEYEHLLILQEKINSYLAFCEQKEYIKNYKDIVVDYIIFEIHFLYEPTQNAILFLERVQCQLREIGILIECHISEEEINENR